MYRWATKNFLCLGIFLLTAAYAHAAVYTENFESGYTLGAARIEVNLFALDSSGM